MDIITRLFGYKIGFYPLFKFTPRLFSLAYIILFVGICLNIRHKKWCEILSQDRPLRAVFLFIWLEAFLLPQFSAIRLIAAVVAHLRIDRRCIYKEIHDVFGGGVRDVAQRLAC